MSETRWATTFLPQPLGAPPLQRVVVVGTELTFSSLGMAGLSCTATGTASSRNPYCMASKTYTVSAHVPTAMVMTVSVKVTSWHTLNPICLRPYFLCILNSPTALA